MLDFDDKNVLKYKKWLKFEKLKIDENELGQIASKHTTNYCFVVLLLLIRGNALLLN